MPATANLLILIGLLVVVNASGQQMLTESPTLKGWTKATSKLDYTDFQGKPTPQFLRLNKEAGLQGSAQIGLKSILDVPKRKRDQGRLLEKVYVAPFFIKSASVLLRPDSLELAKQQLYFDMGEVHARMMRRDIIHIQDTARAYGIIWMLYASLKDYYCQRMGEMVDDYTYEVFVEKTPGAFEKWRELIDRSLRELVQFATTAEDCHRLITEQPIDPAYIQAERIIDSFIRCGP